MNHIQNADLAWILFQTSQLKKETIYETVGANLNTD